MKNKIKRFQDLLNESKSIKEGIKFNTTYLRLPEGEYSLREILNEIDDLKLDLTDWLKDGWQSVATVGCDSEIIPMRENNFKKLKK